MLRFFFSVCAVTMVVGTAKAGEWPKLEGETDIPVCKQALAVAKATFESDHFYLYAPPVVPKNLLSEVIANRRELAILGGHGLVADQNAFDHALPGRDQRRFEIFWQRSSAFGQRLAITEAEVGWRGDVYSVYAVPERVTQNEFREKYLDGRSVPIKKTRLVDDSWNPPIVFKDGKAQSAWFLDIDSDTAIENWHIYIVGLSDTKQRCTVKFGPDDGALQMLPASVSLLHRLTMSAIRSSHPEDVGEVPLSTTLMENPGYAWASVALRPWAFAGEHPYNTRQEVHDGLEQWSKRGPSYRKLYRKILDAYARAEEDLGGYYEKNFGLAPEDARKMAKYAIDFAFRSYFSFHNPDGGYKSAEGHNPWPDFHGREKASP